VPRAGPGCDPAIRELTQKPIIVGKKLGYRHSPLYEIPLLVPVRVSIHSHPRYFGNIYVRRQA
jgi:hypothetical protein